MIEKGKISAVQLAMMLYSSIVITAILFLPIAGYHYAERDFWISPILSSSIGFLLVWVMCKLDNHYPNETIIQYSCSILGKIVGKIVGAIILISIFYITCQEIWEYASFVHTYFLPLTPEIVVLGSLALVCAFAVRGGVEVMGRLAELITPVLIFLFVAVIMLLLAAVDLRNMFPVLENGMLPIIKASVYSNIWFSEYMIAGFFLPFLKDGENKKKWGFISVLALLSTMIIMNIITLLVLGTATGNFEVPFMNAIQYINIANFISRLEVFVITIWIAGAFIKIYVWFYILSLGMAQWLKLSDYRPIVLPIAFLTILLAVWLVPNVATYFLYLEAIMPILAHTLFILLPLFLILVSFVRKGREQKKRGNQ